MVGDQPDAGAGPCESGLEGADHLRLALEAAVRGGRDTDTVAAIAGGLLGARWGASAVPSAWRRLLHDWPGVRARDLVRLGVLSAQQGRPDRAGWPSAPVVDYGRLAERHVIEQHPDDPQVWLGGVGVLDRLPDGVDAVVPLCRLGSAEVPATGSPRPTTSRSGWSTPPTRPRTRTCPSSSATPPR